MALYPARAARIAKISETAPHTNGDRTFVDDELRADTGDADADGPTMRAAIGPELLA
jgi:hypothetical protein